ncbi:MAG: response regulator [Desulfobacteraceae bacterium]|nr:response regulator [Desulfobacteraceae bacterium]
MARILIVDDENEIREMLRQMFEREGFEVVEAPDGKEALKVFRQEQTDLVITDIIMPEQEGLETIIKLRKEFPEVKIIAMSGGGIIEPEPYLNMAEKVGALRTFTKPVNRKELLEKVREVLKVEGER